MKGILPWLVLWACRAGTRDFCSALTALVGPVQNIFSHPRTLFHFLCLHRPAKSRQPCWIACLVIRVSLVPTGYVCSVLARQRMICFLTSIYNELWKRRRVNSAYSFTVSFRRGEGLQYQQVHIVLGEEEKKGFYYLQCTLYMQCIGEEKKGF